MLHYPHILEIADTACQLFIRIPRNDRQAHGHAGVTADFEQSQQGLGVSDGVVIAQPERRVEPARVPGR